jgi:general secretion pathway protein H
VSRGRATIGSGAPARARRTATCAVARTGRARGFTLIELLVVVSVIALLAGLAAPALGSLTGADARKAATGLAGAMRYMFDTASLQHSKCRVALDLDKRAWSAECKPGGGGAVREGREDAADLERRFPGEKNAELRALLARTEFGAYDESARDKHELPGSARFGTVNVEGRRAAESGVVMIHFAPGQAERAYVPIVDGDNVYTIVVEPFTGRAKIVVGKVEVRE